MLPSNLVLVPPDTTLVYLVVRRAVLVLRNQDAARSGPTSDKGFDSFFLWYMAAPQLSSSMLRSARSFLTNKRKASSGHRPDGLVP